MTITWGPDHQWCRVTSRSSPRTREIFSILTVLALVTIVLMVSVPTGGSEWFVLPVTAFAVMLALSTLGAFLYGSTAEFTRQPSRFVYRLRRVAGWRVEFDGPLETIERVVVVRVAENSDDVTPLSNALNLHVIAAGRLFVVMSSPRYELGGPRNELEAHFDTLATNLSRLTHRPLVEWTVDQLLEFQGKPPAADERRMH